MLYFPAPPSFYWWSSIIHSHMYFKLIALMSIIRLRISLYQFNGCLHFHYDNKNMYNNQNI